MLRLGITSDLKTANSQSTLALQKNLSLKGFSPTAASSDVTASYGELRLVTVTNTKVFPGMIFKTKAFPDMVFGIVKLRPSYGKLRSFTLCML